MHINITEAGAGPLSTMLHYTRLRTFVTRWEHVSSHVRLRFPNCNGLQILGLILPSELV
jgi:hypothetical protein